MQLTLDDIINGTQAPESVDQGSGAPPLGGGAVPTPPTSPSGQYLHVLESGESFLAPDPQFPNQPQYEERTQGPVPFNQEFLSTQPQQQQPQTPGPAMQPAPMAPSQAQPFLPQGPGMQPQPPLEGAGPQAPVDYTQVKSLDDILADSPQAQSQAAPEQGMFSDYLAGVNNTLAHVLGLPFDIPMGVLNELGAKLVKSNPTLEDIAQGKVFYENFDVGKSIAEAFQNAGIRTQIDPKSLSSAAGSETVKGLLSTAAIIYAAPAVVARYGTRAIGVIANAISKNPGGALATTPGASIGATYGRALVDPEQHPVASTMAQVAGGMAGGIVTAPITAMGPLAARGVKGLVNMGAKALGFQAPFQKPAGPPVSTLRDPFADPTFPQRYADDQIKGDLARVEQAIKDAIDSVPRPVETYKSGPRAGQPKTNPDGSPMFTPGIDTQARLAKALDNALNKVARPLEKKFWSKVDLNQKVPSRMVYDGLDSMVARFQQAGTAAPLIPEQLIKDTYQLFAPSRGMPKLSAVRSHMSVIDDARRAELSAIANGAGSRERLANLTRLYGVLADAIDDAFDSDIPLRQAMAYSRKMNEVFFNEGLVDVFSKSRGGASVVSPGQMLDHIKGQFQGVKTAAQIEKELKGVKRIHGQQNAYPTAIEPSSPEAAKLAEVTQSLDDAIRTQFRENAVDERAASAWIGANRDKIRGAAQSAAEIDHVGAELAQQSRLRFEIERSALAQFAKNDPQIGIKKLFTGNNPSAQARDIVRRVGQDKDALSGLRAGVLDELVSRTGQSPSKMLALMDENATGRMLAEVFEPQQIALLKKLVKVGAEIEAGGIQTTAQKYGKGITLAGRIFAAKLSGGLSAITSAGQLQTASMLSTAAKEKIGALLGNKIPPGQLLANALRDPAWAKLLLSKEPVDMASAEALKKTMLRVIRAEEGLRQATMDQIQNGNVYTHPYPDPQSQPMQPQFFESMTGPDQLREGFRRPFVPIERPRFKGANLKESDREAFQTIGSVDKGGKFMSRLLAESPRSQNIEDRRGRGYGNRNPFQGYKEVLEDADRMGYSQNLIFRGLTKRPGDKFPGGIPPTPRPRPR